MDNYFVVDIETCPHDIECYFKLVEEEQLKKLNPIDSKIVALGIRYNGENKLFMGDEKEILEEFWLEWETIKKGNSLIRVVGFNIANFDLPFITARSFIHGIVISPFLLKQIVDLRDKINAYRYGNTRGKLKEYAGLIKLRVLDVDGSDMAKLVDEKKFDEIKKYLANDLEITDKLYQRAVETKVINIDKW